jgi:hypothetical protein
MTFSSNATLPWAPTRASLSIPVSAGAAGDLDRSIQLLFGAATADEGEIISATAPLRVKVVRQAMIDCTPPARPRHSGALRVRDGDQGHHLELAHQGVEDPADQGGYAPSLLSCSSVARIRENGGSQYGNK